MGLQLTLPTPDGMTVYALRGRAAWPSSQVPATSRVAYAAAHVVADPRLADGRGGTSVDWDATMAFRHHLWRLGLGVADAMDTAQRGMGLNWTLTQELISRSGAEARAVGGKLSCGAGTDQLTGGQHTLDDIVSAYEEQVSVVRSANAGVILMASRALAAAARDAEDYLDVYGQVLAQVDQPVILHWLGSMFDPALQGYWGSEDLDIASETVLALIREHRPKVDGIKVSLLDAGHEIALRRALPDRVRLYTGDDFNYPELIRGDEQGHSDALLGIFDAIAAPSAAALHALDAQDLASYDAIMAPTVPLARAIFETPTYHYKTGIVFLAWLSGHQEEFCMLGAQEQSRNIEHFSRLFRLADQANLFPDPELAVQRMNELLARQGVGV